MKISLASGGLDFHPSHVIALLGSPFPYSVLAGEREYCNFNNSIKLAV